MIMTILLEKVLIFCIRLRLVIYYEPQRYIRSKTTVAWMSFGLKAAASKLSEIQSCRLNVDRASLDFFFDEANVEVFESRSNDARQGEVDRHQGVW
jgi:hypothetical protein